MYFPHHMIANIKTMNTTLHCKTKHKQLMLFIGRKLENTIANQSNMKKILQRPLRSHQKDIQSLLLVVYSISLLLGKKVICSIKVQILLFVS